MSNTVPASRPQITPQALFEKMHAAHPGVTLPEFFICGIRGYYQDTMGEPGVNDRKIYDDAIFLVGQNELISFNGNTDPSAFKLEIANLKPGIWPVYKFDLHKGQYLALCQRAGKVTVIRDGTGEDTGMFGINIHRGGNWTTSSLGCQTIPPTQWEDFINYAQVMAKKAYGTDYKTKTYTYILLEN